MINRFIPQEGFNHWFTSDIPIYDCRFDPQSYRDALFDTLGVQFPDSLSNAVVKRRAEFLAGRYCAIKSLQENGINGAQIATGQDRNPIWPQNVSGSISHSHNHAVAVTIVSPKKVGVGIDIEGIVTADTFESINQQIIDPTELEFIERQGGDTLQLFTLLFSLKESFFKAAYPVVKKYFDFDAVSIKELNHADSRLSFKLNYTLHNKLKKDQVFEGAFRTLPDNKIVTFVKIDYCD